ncbi:hypothetical protein KQX54_017999 [Cotesia glomerata]|uniref:Nudix hydrolase domain-containing protein n=1 Tax=Cotesia glomerata TaxID=32391 RepID=A0AAV7HFV4_COTGL|nr:hypothetical protein KQX54_017999 [Cotesia glomerata]
MFVIKIPPGGTLNPPRAKRFLFVLTTKGGENQSYEKMNERETKEETGKLKRGRYAELLDLLFEPRTAPFAELRIALESRLRPLNERTPTGVTFPS